MSVFAAEGAAAVARHATVRIDDDLPAGKPRVTKRPADHEASRWVDEIARAAVEELRIDHRLDHMLRDRRGDLWLLNVRGMLRRDHDRVNAANRLAESVLDRNLALAIGPQPRKHAALPHLGQPPRQPVRERDRHRHELGCLVAGKAEHHPLIARAGLQLVVRATLTYLERWVNSLRDIARLTGENDVHLSGVGRCPVRPVRVADLSQGLANQPFDLLGRR